MLHKYECDKCGSVCYIESEVWESCPICEVTPEERRLKDRAERAENLLDYVCDKIYDWHSDCDCHSVGPMRECINKIEKFLEGE